MINTLCPIKHPDHASLNCFDKSLTYTANNRGDKMPLCLTPFETVKKTICTLAPFNAHFLVTIPKDQHSNNQQRNFTNNKLIKEFPVIYTIKCLERI